MDGLSELVNQWIWRQDFWLPPGVTWKDIAEGTADGSRCPAHLPALGPGTLLYYIILYTTMVCVCVLPTKMFNYAGWRKTCDALFVIFAAVFLVTRLVVFPCRIVYTAVVDSLDVFPPYPGYYFLNGLLLVLQALHIFWAWLILRMVHKFVFLGKVERDERSDEESEADEEEDEGGEEVHTWEQKKGALNSKLALLANNCVLNNLTNPRRKMNSRTPKAR
uniref:Ceramide synthase 4a n=1 Tax=Sinocyclocheilus rhinocerous TaxID=307959 RepID=A0A673K8F9_9TELE